MFAAKDLDQSTHEYGHVTLIPGLSPFLTATNPEERSGSWVLTAQHGQFSEDGSQAYTCYSIATR